ncbi:hypothetical protein PENANT_c047G01791 [Penicillium antarcticum]|uniref:Uncharacterized protein n=1 Tax=Penicillium antarcticum TaxID=416450 RepID=A0A1V6PRG7_9EURO|nr:hypothetical protein PENANT_c047G01791 [Penicillium antarcticum]
MASYARYNGSPEHQASGFESISKAWSMKVGSMSSKYLFTATSERQKVSSPRTFWYLFMSTDSYFCNFKLQIQDDIGAP